MKHDLEIFHSLRDIKQMKPTPRVTKFSDLWITEFLDFDARPIFQKLENTFRKVDSFRPQVGEDTWRRKHIQFPKRCVFSFLKYRKKDKVQEPSNSDVSIIYHSQKPFFI
jgi:hypothetical protein